MSKENWTKGEWVWVDTWLNGKDGEPVMDYAGCGSHECSVTEANAHLIAAAPKLYEALKVMVEDFKQLADSGDAGFWKAEDQPEYKQAMAALAAARGENV